MQRNNSTKQNNRSFTLIELLVVLALVAILSVVVILTLNPAELIKQARDSNRLSDLSTINTALNLFSADVTSGFMGTSTVVYVSIPDNASSTCGSLGLPALPTGYTYKCATTATLRNTDGTGWIPVNFQRISSNSPVSQLPVDPINTTSTRLYYTYVSGGSWELNATVEASKNKLGGSGDLVSKDGGSATSQYEIGNNLNLNPLETGDSSLVGYWNFEEGSGATTPDRSGAGNSGTWNGTGAHYVAGKVGVYAGQFNGTDDFSQIAVVSSTSSLNITGPMTLSIWYYGVGGCGGTNSLGEIGAAAAGFQGYTITGCTALLGYFGDGSTWINTSSYTVTPSIWVMAAILYDGTNVHLYIDGLEYGSPVALSRIQSLSGLNFRLGAHHTDGTGYAKGRIDDIRLYSRALSSAEILALYNATK